MQTIGTADSGNRKRPACFLVRTAASALLAALLALFILAGPTGATAQASGSIQVKLNDAFLGAGEATIVGGRTLVPFRALFEALGASVHYDAATSVITATRGRTRVTLHPESKLFVVNGESIILDVSTRVVNGRLMVPVRVIAMSLGADVGYDPDEQLVYVSIRPVTGISLDKRELILDTGESATLVATVSPADASSRRVNWYSNDSSVATVYSSGISEAVVTSNGAGTAIIVAQTEDGGYSATCSVTVKARHQAVTGISLDRYTMELIADEGSKTITARVEPDDASDRNVTWSSSDTSVVTVHRRSLTGATVTPHRTGTAIITAKTEDGGFEATCRVTVQGYSEPVTGIELDRGTLSLTAGSSPGTLEATIYPRRASNLNMTWSSSNTSVATVHRHSVDGRYHKAIITPLQSGETIITATTEDGEFKATCVVTVE